MNLQVRGRNIEVTDALKNYVLKRVGKLDKYLDNAVDAMAIMSVEKGIHRIEVTIPLNGMYLRGEEGTGDMYSSIDLVVEKLEKQINKYKGKLSRRGVRFAGEPRYVPSTPVEEDDTPRLVRTKRFAIKPMPAEEAVLQMNLLGHSFFVFSNAETEQVNVVYKRKDGNYGLIEQEF
jgi:putative sigma-54 modulation protein